MTGSWTFAGGMSTAMISGHDTSQLVLAQMDGTRAILTNPQMDLALEAAPLSAAPDPRLLP